MRPAFDESFFGHLNQACLAETGQPSRLYSFMERVIAITAIRGLLVVFERSATIILTLPIPIYAMLVRLIIGGARGLPSFAGVYLRALYYRGVIRKMESNVIIEQGVFIAFPENTTLKEFCFLDKNVIIMAKSVQIGRRVHIAPNVFISGGGAFRADDYSCIATGSQLITSTEILKGGARCSGPMVSADQRNVHRGQVVLEKDAFVGAGATILTDVVIAQGSVVGGGVTVARSTEAWGVYAGTKPALIGMREKVKHPDN